MTFWHVFDSVQARYGDRVAVEMQRAAALERWTYHDLHRAALAHAARLTAAGVGRGDRCALLADNDARWCAAYLGIFQLGAVAVPLDTNYTARQVARILDDAGPVVLFVSERLAPVAREAVGARPGIRIAPLGDRTDAVEHPPLSVDVAPASPAVILYTSGTTADPKGVVLSHANLLAERDAAFAVVPVSERDSVLGVLPLFHALAQLANLLLPFAVGARVVFLESLNSAELVRALAERQITIFACVPQFFYLIHQRISAEVGRGGLVVRALFASLLALNLQLRRLHVNLGPLLFRKVHALLGRQMRLFITGGSKFDPAIGRDFYALGFTILQAYGLTETSGAATINRPDEAHLDTVGRVLPDHELRLVPAADGASDGEIAIRGPIVMQGYFNRPEATAAVLQDGWFLTGDLGRLDAQGRLTITGRRKEVIVLASGKNIYPEEVEAQYRQSPFISDICVLGLTRPGEPTSERLFAVVTPNTDLLRERRIANAGDLLRFEIEGQSIHLPPHKRVLGYDIWFTPLPRTTTGKLKRHEIEALVREKQRAAATREVDVTVDHWAGDPHARAVADVIRRRAPRGVVTPEAYLELDLALDSMERVELLAELEQRLGVRVPQERAHDILTVQQLIDALGPGRGGAAAESKDESWAAILEDLPSEREPALAALVMPRRVMPAVFFALLKLIAAGLPPIRVTGRAHLPAEGAFIISPNHQSFLDPFVICAALPFSVFRQLFFVGATEYFETRLTAWAARQFNLLPVDPDANLVPAMKAGAFGLSRGKVLMLFPEGERSIDGTVKRFKKGAPILSRHLSVPIVPVAIHGVYELWPRNRPFHWRGLLPGRRRPLQVAFGPSLTVPPATSSAEGAALLEGQVRRMWEALDQSPEERRQP